MSAKDFPGSPGHVREMKWTPDGCACIMSWSKGGISLWSTFGTMLMCSLGWDYGLHVDLANRNPLDITCMVSDLVAIKWRNSEIRNLSYAGLVNGRLPAVYVATAEDLLGRRASGHTDSGQSWCKWLKFAAKTAKAYTHAYLLEFVGEEHTFVVRTWARVYRTDHTCSTGFCQEQFYR